jgi:hypothetical protein
MRRATIGSERNIPLAAEVMVNYEYLSTLGRKLANDILWKYYPQYSSHNHKHKATTRTTTTTKNQSKVKYASSVHLTPKFSIIYYNYSNLADTLRAYAEKPIHKICIFETHVRSTKRKQENNVIKNSRKRHILSCVCV